MCCPRRHRSYGLSRQSGALSATSRFAVIGRVLAIRSGLGWAPDLPHFETSILSLVPPPLRRGAPRVHMSDSFPADTGLRPVLTGSALPIPTVGHEHPPKGALGGRPSRRCSDSLDAAAPRIARAPGPTDLQWGRAAGHLYFRAFTPKGRPPGAPDMTTWAIGKLPGRDSHPLDRCCYGLHQKTGLSAWR